MNLNGRFGRITLILSVFAITVFLVARAHGQNKSYWVLYDFGQGKSDGWNPSPPAVAKNGDLYGVTGGGGDYNSGTAFKLTAPKIRGGKWKWSSLYEFPGGNGGAAPGLPMLGDDGNLYGAEYSYSVFELSAPKSGDGVWKYELLYTLNGTTDGAGVVGLVMDEKGNIYGATQGGGDMSGCNHYGCGTVFELKRPTKNGGKWRFSLLYTFTGSSTGEEPFAGVTLDQTGKLYGTTHSGGAFGYGTAYSLTPPAKKGRPWTENVLYSFDPTGTNGNTPTSPLILDDSGDIYGTTPGGGDPNCQGGVGCGVVYELTPPAKKGGSWSYATLYAFQGGNDGSTPTGYMVFDTAGNLYGTTEYGGGETEGGTVYRLSPPGGSGGAWTESVLHGFVFGSDGAVPQGLTWGKWNDLYGVTEDGGTECQGCGTAFEIRP